MKTIALLAVGSCAVGQSSSGVQAFRKIARVGGDFAQSKRSSTADFPDINLDTVNVGADSAGGTTSGRLVYVGNYGTVETDTQVLPIHIDYDQDIYASEQNRIADDVDGNGNAGVTRVLADIDGDGVIEEGEVIGIINDFGDLHSYNVFFDVVTVEQSEGFSSLELVKQHIFFADHGVNTGDTGWRFQAYHEDWSAAVGDEVQGLWGLGDEALDSVSKPWLRDLLDETRFSTYGTTGLRSLMLDRRFAFLGQGSILSRTWVDQQIDHYLVGPQLGLGVVAEASMFRFEAVAMGLAGYGRVENLQSGVFDDEASHYHSDEDQFAWHGETRLTGSCQLTQRLRLDATWRWYVTGPVYDPAGSIDWDSPNFGFRQSVSDEAYGNDWFFGLTYTH